MGKRPLHVSCFALIFALLILPTLCPKEASSDGDNLENFMSPTPLLQFDSPPLFWFHNQSLYYLNGDSTFRVNPVSLQGEEVQRMEVDTDAKRLPISEGFISISPSGQWVVNNGLTTVSSGDFSALENDTVHQTTKRVLQADWIDHTLCLLISLGDEPEQNVLLYFSPENREWNVDQTTGITAFSQYKNGTLLVYSGGKIMPYDLKNQKLGDALVFADQTPFSYHHQSNTLYFVSGGNIYQKVGDNAPQLLVIIPYMFSGENSEYSKPTIQGIAAIGDSKIAYSMNNALFIADTTPLSHVLRVKQPPKISLFDNAGDYFRKQNPYVAFEYYYEDFPMDAAYDINMTGNEFDLAKLIRIGGFADLSGSEYIKQRYETYFPQAQEALGREGKPVAVPTSMYISPWIYDAETWEDLGLPDPPKTVDAFFSLLDLWDREYADKYPNIVLTGEALGGDGFGLTTGLALTYQYMYENGSHENPVSYNTPAYRNMIKRTFELPPDWALAQVTNRDIPLLFSLHDSRPYIVTVDDLAREEIYCHWYPEEKLPEEYKPIIPPGFANEQSAQIGAWVTAIAVMEDAPNPTLAMDFVEFISVHADMNQSDLAFMLSPDHEEPPIHNPSVTNFYHDAMPRLSFHVNAMGAQLDGDACDAFYYAYAHDMLQYERGRPTVKGVPSDEMISLGIESLDDLAMRIFDDD